MAAAANMLAEALARLADGVLPEVMKVAAMVAVVGADDDGLLGGYNGTGTMTTGGTGKLPALPGRREL